MNTELKRISTPALLACLGLSCASTNLPPVTSYSGGFEPLPDERRLWDDARLEERTLREHLELYDDPEFSAYTEDILTRLEPPSERAPGAPDYRVYLVADPSANAFSYPHGSIYLHTGLLARVDSEAQLAALLAHEIEHVERRHAVRRQRQERNQRNRWIVAGIAATAVLVALDIDAIEDGDWDRHFFVGTLADAFVEVGFDALALAATCSIEGYGYALEGEADDGAFTRLAYAGYDVDDAARVFDLLLDDSVAASVTRSFFYADREALEGRRARLNGWLAAHGDRGPGWMTADPDRFQRRIEPIRRLQDELAAGLPEGD